MQKKTTTNPPFHIQEKGTQLPYLRHEQINYLTGETYYTLNDYEKPYTPKFQFRSNQLLIYNQFINNNEDIKGKFNSLDKANESYTGIFTNSAKKNMKRSIDIFSQIIKEEIKIHPLTKKPFKHSLSFITLNIPDKVILHPTWTYKKLLKPFIEWLTKTIEIKYYIWKLEWQQRGQIHYHITIDKPIHHKLIRNKWNYLINKNNLALNYISKHNHNQPPSTAINKVYKETDISGYLQKEFLKSIQNDNPHKNNCVVKDAGNSYKCWDCSENLKGNKYYTVDINKSIYYEIMQDYQIIVDPKQVKLLEHCTLIKFNQKIIDKIIPFQFTQDYQLYLHKIKNKQKCKKSEQK